MEEYRREKNQGLESKLNMSGYLKAKMSINERNKVKKDQENFGYGNILWADVISKEMTALQRHDVFQLYIPKTKFDKKYGWQDAPMYMIFDVNQQDL